MSAGAQGVDGERRAQSVAPRDELDLLYERQGSRGRGFERLQIGDQGRGMLDGLLAQRLQPLAADVGVGRRGDDGEDDAHDDDAGLAEAGTPPRPVQQVDEGEGGGGGQDCAGGARGGDLELGGRGGAVGVAGEGGGADAGLLAEELRGGDEVAEVLEEALVVGAAEAGVDGFLGGISGRGRAAVAVLPSMQSESAQRSRGGWRGCAAAGAGGL